jgi:hypothetical protein
MNGVAINLRNMISKSIRSGLIIIRRRLDIGLLNIIVFEVNHRIIITNYVGGEGKTKLGEETVFAFYSGTKL